MYDIIFRCDASNIKNIGTGHVYRSLAIADYFSEKFKIKKKNFLFVTKTYENNNYVKKIVKEKGYKICEFVGSEITFLKKFKTKSLIIDRVKIENQKNINILKNNFNKIICLDSENKNLKNCLRINSLIHNKNIKFSGYKYLITPIINNTKYKNIIHKKKIFISLGGIKKKEKVLKILNILKKLDRFKISIPEFLRKNKNNITTYNSSTFYKNLFNSNLVICSGGLILFDCLFLKKKIICLPNDKYQKKNIQNIKNVKNYKIFFQNDLKNLEKNIIKILSLKNYKTKFYMKDMKNTLNRIYNYIYD